ncbi:hypothetical protein N44_04757 [Microcystis aeruginosa NIES-44]|uniref:Uncharacterized protein n=1 Tax=Microcystis aeruginosa NIES-44 TaxID=449439 RepID=A0A0A1W312_MICAE|nr:hypothetical protein N44_04757 [Microcystis aeruginosa NIES-44]
MLSQNSCLDKLLSIDNSYLNGEIGIFRFGKLVVDTCLVLR